MEDQKKDRTDPKIPLKKKRSHQLQAHNMPTD